MHRLIFIPRPIGEKDTGVVPLRVKALTYHVLQVMSEMEFLREITIHTTQCS